MSGLHRQPEPLAHGERIEDGRGQAARLRAEQKYIAWAVVDAMVWLLTAGAQRKPSRRQGITAGGQVGMDTHPRPLVIIQPGATQTAVVELEAEWLDHMQRGPRIGAQAYDVAGIRWYLRLIQDDMKHD